MLTRMFKPMMFALQALLLMNLTFIWWSNAAKDSLIRRIERFKKHQG